MYIWQHENWPHFTYQATTVSALFSKAVAVQQALMGQEQHLPGNLDRDAEMDALIQNALRTSAIEGEDLNVGSVKSSVARHLGLEQAGLSSSTQQTDSLVAMLTDATQMLAEPLTQSMLCDWQAALFTAPSMYKQFIRGDLRGNASMQVVSRRGVYETVHFEAPPKACLQEELTAFLQWFNDKDKDAGNPEKLIERAAIAHLWLITLHPFEDGNGRVTRAVTDRALAQAESTSIRFYSLSAAIEANRKTYYDTLEQTQNCKTQQQQDDPLDITEWIAWFLERLIEALQQGITRIQNVVKKSLFWQQHSQTILIGRQVKVLNRLLDSLGYEFKEGIAARHYQSLAKVSKATATRDLADLVQKKCLLPLEGGGRSMRYGLNLDIT